MAKQKRMIDNKDLRDKLAKLHLLQIEELLRKAEDEFGLEPQEHRLVWDMVRTHGIGLESVDDLVKEAQDGLGKALDDIGSLDGEWTV